MSDHPIATVTSPTEMPASNGHGPKMPRRLLWVPIPGYGGFEAQVWTNAPQRHFNDLGSGDAARYLDALKVLLVAVRTVDDGHTWDGWYDCDGEPLPALEHADFLEAVPTELLICTVRAIAESPSAYPNSLTPTRRR